jgi:hypothetical protein
MSNTIDKLRSKLEDVNLDQDFRGLLQEAISLIERQQDASLDLQASLTRLQKRYSELGRNAIFGEFSGVAVWHGDFRLQLVESKLASELGKTNPIPQMLDRAKAEFLILTESQNAQNHPKQD